MREPFPLYLILYIIGLCLVLLALAGLAYSQSVKAKRPDTRTRTMDDSTITFPPDTAGPKQKKVFGPPSSAELTSCVALDGAGEDGNATPLAVTPSSGGRSEPPLSHMLTTPGVAA